MNTSPPTLSSVTSICLHSLHEVTDLVGLRILLDACCDSWHRPCDSVRGLSALGRQHPRSAETASELPRAPFTLDFPRLQTFPESSRVAGRRTALQSEQGKGWAETTAPDLCRGPGGRGHLRLTWCANESSSWHCGGARRVLVGTWSAASQCDQPPGSSWKRQNPGSAFCEG